MQTSLFLLVRSQPSSSGISWVTGGAIVPTRHILICGLFCWSTLHFMKCVVGESLCIYELHKVDRTCESQEKRQKGGESYPGHPGGLCRAMDRWSSTVQDCVPPPHRLLPSGLGSALPLERSRDGALQKLITIVFKVSPSPWWHHKGHSGTLGNIWHRAAARWNYWGLCQHVIFHSSFGLRAERFGRRFITKQQSFVLQAHSYSCSRQSWNGIFFSKVTLRGKQQVLRWWHGMCWWALLVPFPSSCVMKAVINLLSPALHKPFPPGFPLWKLRCKVDALFQLRLRKAQDKESPDLSDGGRSCQHRVGISPSSPTGHGFNFWWRGGRYHHISHKNETHKKSAAPGKECQACWFLFSPVAMPTWPCSKWNLFLSSAERKYVA